MNCLTCEESRTPLVMSPRGVLPSLQTDILTMTAHCFLQQTQSTNALIKNFEEIFLPLLYFSWEISQKTCPVCFSSLKDNKFPLESGRQYVQTLRPNWENTSMHCTENIPILDIGMLKTKIWLDPDFLVDTKFWTDYYPILDPVPFHFNLRSHYRYRYIIFSAYNPKNFFLALGSDPDLTNLKVRSGKNYQNPLTLIFSPGFKTLPTGKLWTFPKINFISVPEHTNLPVVFSPTGTTSLLSTGTGTDNLTNQRYQKQKTKKTRYRYRYR
jgi:hypothetical protein